MKKAFTKGISGKDKYYLAEFFLENFGDPTDSSKLTRSEVIRLIYQAPQNEAPLFILKRFPFIKG
jgi:GDP-D-mannose dehydratase